MYTETTSLKGKIIGFANNGILAVVETELGNAYLDINDALDYRLRVGDEISVEEAGGYITNGQIVTVLGYEYVLNGMKITHKETEDSKSSQPIT